jgi:hypothetical protein
MGLGVKTPSIAIGTVLESKSEPGAKILKQSEGHLVTAMKKRGVGRFYRRNDGERIGRGKRARRSPPHVKKAADREFTHHRARAYGSLGRHQTTN